MTSPSQTPEAKRKRQADAKAAGMCPNHVHVNAAAGYAACEQCLIRLKQASKKQRAKNVDNGVCMNHGNEPVVPGLTICKMCQTKKQEIYNDRKCNANNQPQ